LSGTYQHNTTHTVNTTAYFSSWVWHPKSTVMDFDAKVTHFAV